MSVIIVAVEESLPRRESNPNFPSSILITAVLTEVF
jgi:hypothetical protein